MSLIDQCSQCSHPLCSITVPRFHYRHYGINSLTLIKGVPAQQALLWDFFEFALKNCFEVQNFRVMLFYGLYEHDLDYFIRETDELKPEDVIAFLKRTNQVITKLTNDFKRFQREMRSLTDISDIIPNIITIIQMELVGLAHNYLHHHASDPDFHFTINDILR
ncbi:hypothetical protein WDW89_25625 [Deltaproteobacteria bacterium TL4]